MCSPLHGVCKRVVCSPSFVPRTPTVIAHDSVRSIPPFVGRSCVGIGPVRRKSCKPRRSQPLILSLLCFSFHFPAFHKEERLVIIATKTVWERQKPCQGGLFIRRRRRRGSWKNTMTRVELGQGGWVGGEFWGQRKVYLSPTNGIETGCTESPRLRLLGWNLSQ